MRIPFIPMDETNHFFNPGYGWLCKHCSAEDAERKHLNPGEHARFFREGEGEKEPKLAMMALARWTDPSREELACERCGVKEIIGKR